jgi:hypothetical protein
MGEACGASGVDVWYARTVDRREGAAVDRREGAAVDRREGAAVDRREGAAVDGWDTGDVEGGIAWGRWVWDWIRLEPRRPRWARRGAARTACSSRLRHPR